MSYCLNPSCDNPLNADGTELCQSCGTRIIPLLRNRYRIIQPLGGGGFGRTFLAEDEDKLKEHCVVKQLAPRVSGTTALHKATELFHEEARRLQQLGEHPQIPTLYAYFQQDHYLYLVQQLIPGQTLRQELKQQGTFSEEQIWQILRELLPVLKFIHDYQVIHRDLKPDNIIRRCSQDTNSFSASNLVLIDFGVAKQVTATSMEHTGTSIGSYGYAPMEQMKNGLAYPASDLFSLGATCFYLLTAIHPYHLYMEQGYSWVSCWRQNLQSPISTKLQQVLDKLLQKDLAHRYQSADEVLQDIPTQRKQVVSPIQPLPLKINLKSSVFPKTVIQTEIGWRHKRLIGCAGVILLLGFGGFLHSWQNLSLTGHLADVNSLAFQPHLHNSASGKTIFASGSDDTTIKLWHLEKKRKIRTFKGHSDWIYAVTISQDGQTLVSGSKDNTIKVWNLHTGEKIRTLTGHKSYVHSVAVSPDNQILVSGGYDSLIKVWNLNTGEEIRTIRGHLGEVLFVAIHPDGQSFLSGGTDDTIKIWNLNTGEKIFNLTGHSADVNALAISPNGNLMVSASDDKTIKLWNFNTGKEIRTLSGHEADVNAIAFSQDGISIATGSDDNTVKVWNLSTGQVIHDFRGHTAEVFAVAFSPDGKTLISGSKDQSIKIWQLP